MLINNSGASHYSYVSSQTHMSVINGKKTETTEAVHIKNGKGAKKVVKSVNGKTRKSTIPLTQQEIQSIMDRKFMPDFFVPCYKGCEKAVRKPASTRSASLVRKPSAASLVRKTKKASKKLSK